MAENDSIRYRVVVNHEEQYSIWPVGRENAPGWKDAGKEGSKEECLEHINEVWTDMRPLSLRKKMEEMAKNPPQAEEAAQDEAEQEPPLVERLAQPSRVEVSIRPERTAAALKECLERGYVHVKFTETRGGTEIGVPLDEEASKYSSDALEAGEGELHLEGDLTLDFTRVRCIADIDLKSFQGTGRLQPVKQAATA